MDRVTIFGAGHVGATAAFYLALSASLDIRLVDIEEGRAHGLALDIGQSLPYTGSGSTVRGGTDAAFCEGSDLVVITAGSPRLPGMSRLDLTAKNAPVVRGISRAAASLAPGAVMMVVTNPVDEMTYLARESSGFERSHVMGMAGVLDTSRFLYFLDELASVRTRDVNALVLGTHGDDMVPLPDWSRTGDSPLSSVVSGDVLESVTARTRDGGAEIVGHLRSGSAYFAPAVSIGVTALAVLADTGRVLPVSAWVDGQYGIEGVFLGVPAKIGRRGVQEVLELPLSAEEKAGLENSAEGIRRRISELEGVLDADD